LNYRECIDDAIEFIETNIKEKLTAQQISEQMGYSVYHFCRVFALQKDVTLMDYVRKRRLSIARSELLKGKRIIDIAVEYGYETASGFAKSFRKEFGYSPTTYMARMSDIDLKLLTRNGDYSMNPIIMKKESFKVAGYGIETNVTNGHMKDIAAYWDTYTGENLENKMYTQLCPPKHGEVGICFSSTKDENIVYLLGVIVDDFTKATPDMITVEVPEAEYAVFTTPPVDLTNKGSDTNDPLADVVKATWKYIFEEWFPNSGYRYDESKIDFEFYDERCHSHPDSTMDIYIPILKK
jgi:AraC family transcriptional regulator